MLVCGLAVPFRFLAMRLGRVGMQFRLIVLAMLMVMGRFPVLMCRHLVFRCRGLVCAQAACLVAVDMEESPSKEHP